MVNVNLGEGNTPLIESVHVGPSLGLSRLFLKLENCNPSGSYKDRFVAAEIARCLSLGVRACVATSSGNTGAALTAYCARYGLQSFIVVNENAPAGKLEQMLAHRAQIIRVKNFLTSRAVTDSVYRCLMRLSCNRGLPLIVSAFRYCPEGMLGVEAISRELSAQLRCPIHHVFVPVGGGGLFSAVCQGFRRQGAPQPRVHAVQPKGCSTVVAAFQRGDDEIRSVESTTSISGLAVPFDIDASLALGLLRKGNGRGFSVDDDEVLEAQGLMLSKEGIYCEPAGAAALAGLIRAVQEGIVGRNETVVCLVTGHGFKDMDSVRRATADCVPITVEASELEHHLLERV